MKKLILLLLLFCMVELVRADQSGINLSAFKGDTGATGPAGPASISDTSKIANAHSEYTPYSVYGIHTHTTYVPYTGATSNTNLNTKNLLATNIHSNTRAQSLHLVVGTGGAEVTGSLAVGGSAIAGEKCSILGNVGARTSSTPTASQLSPILGIGPGAFGQLSAGMQVQFASPNWYTGATLRLLTNDGGGYGDITQVPDVPRVTIAPTGGVFMHYLTTPGANQVAVNFNTATSEIVRAASSQRYKVDINDYDPGDLIDNLRVRQFKWGSNTSSPGVWDYGMVAEEVYEVFPNAVALDAKGRPEGVRYELMGVLAIKECQQLRKRVLELEKAVEELKAKNV